MSDSDFASKIKNRSLSIGVIGLGYVGLPTAISFYDEGFRVYGVDIDETVVANLSEGKNPIFDSNLNAKTPDIKSSRWNVSSSFRDTIPVCDVIIVTVPTPVSSKKKLDDSKVLEAGKSIFPYIKKNSNCIVVLESTVYPGFTSKIWGPVIDDCDLVRGKDLHLAYCPERHNPGDLLNNMSRINRIIGSEDESVGRLLLDLYSTITTGDVNFVGAMEIAESAKLIENVQRDINIALVNELSMILPKLNVDIEDVLDAASSKWNFHRYTPGIGVGGHCIPVDPYFLIDQANEKNSTLNLISSARAINDDMPNFVSEQILQILQMHGIRIDKSKILILGWAYKPNIGDVRGSPSNHLAKELISYGATVDAWDPHISESEIPDDVRAINDIYSIAGYDLMIIGTAHDAVINLHWSELKAKMRNPLIYDGRRCINAENLGDSGWHAYAIGAPFGHFNH